MRLIGHAQEFCNSSKLAERLDNTDLLALVDDVQLAAGLRKLLAATLVSAR